MAITGLVGVRAAEVGENGFQNAFHVGDAMQANLTVTMAEGSLYANNRRKEHKQKFDSGSLELGVDDLIDTVQVKMLGHRTKSVTVDSSTVTVNVSNEKDSSPVLGVGFYQTVTRNNVDMVRVIILLRTQFAEPADNAQTADNNITMNGRTTTGTIMSDDNGDWKYDVTVATVEEAEALLDAVLGKIS